MNLTVSSSDLVTLVAALLALAAAIGAAGVAVWGTASGAARQSRRDHERWIRELRYESYVAMIRTLNRWMLDEKAQDPDTRQKAQDALTEFNASFFLLGPRYVEQAGLRVSQAVADGDVAAARTELPEFEAAARRALKVEDYLDPGPGSP